MKYLIFFFFLWSCPAANAQQVHDSLLVLSLERTTCYGNCPYYKIKIYSNGLAYYQGKKNVKNIGWYSAKISPRRINQILEKAYQIDYMQLERKYPIKGLGITDFPTCITYVKSQGEQKTVYNKNDAPQSLIEYERFFDKVLENVAWKKIFVLPSE